MEIKVSWKISELQRGDVLRNVRYSRTAEYFALHPKNPEIARVVVRDLKNGNVKARWIKVSQLEKWFPKMVGEWHNPYCN
jgi:hypothetical protein